MSKNNKLDTTNVQPVQPITKEIKNNPNLQNNSIWTWQLNVNGVTPPEGRLQPYGYEKTIYSSVPGIGNGNSSPFDSRLVYINSREPYAAEFMYTNYGTLGSVLGTNLGSGKQ